MGQLPWLKLYTETIDDPKIKRLSVRERWIWVTVLCLAQKSPVNGKLMLTSTQKLDHSDIATAAMLSINDFTEDDKNNGNFEAWTQGGHEEFMVESALKKFESLEMIKRDKNGVVTLCNFLKRQFGKASNAPDEIRKRVESFRKRKKSEHETPSCNADVTRCNAIDKDIDRDKDKEEEKEEIREESLRGEKKNEKTAPDVATTPPQELLKNLREPTVASYFEQKYIQTVKKPVVLGAEFISGLREIVRVHGRKNAMQGIDVFFSTDDPWIIKHGYPPNIFIKQITTFIAGSTDPPQIDSKKLDDLVAKALGENNG